MKLLYLASWFPYPPDNGSRQRTFYLLKELAARHQVSLIAFYDDDQAPPNIDALHAYSANITALPRKNFSPRGARALRGFFLTQPRSVTSTFDANVHAQIQAQAARDKYDALLVGELSMAPYARGLAARVKILDDVEASQFAEPLANARGIERLRKGLTWWKFKKYIQTLAPQFDALTVVSAREQALVEQMGIARQKIQVIANGVDCAASHRITAETAPYTLIYNGALTFAPNLDAMRYFAREILPLVRNAEPRARLLITGRADQVAQNELSEDNVISFTGYVADVKSLVKASAMCVVPLRMGSGTRLKILEAMALQTPVVSTTKGAEGLNVRHGEHVLLADTPRDFANAILQLLRDDALRARLTDAAYQRVCAEYDWAVIARALDRVMARGMTHEL